MLIEHPVYESVSSIYVNILTDSMGTQFYDWNVKKMLSFSYVSLFLHTFFQSSGMN